MINHPKITKEHILSKKYNKFTILDRTIEIIMNKKNYDGFEFLINHDKFQSELFTASQHNFYVIKDKKSLEIISKCNKLPTYFYITEQNFKIEPSIMTIFTINIFNFEFPFTKIIKEEKVEKDTFVNMVKKHNPNFYNSISNKIQQLN